MFKITNVEPTPNPDALKFILDKPILASGSRQFDDAKTAKDDTLATSLFALPGVESVFYMGQFVTVSKDAAADWNKLGPKILEILQKADAAGANGSSNGAKQEKLADKSDDELLNRINEVIDESVRPALAGDGGGLEVVDFKNFTLTIHYQGACGSCPSSTAGTMAAVQNLLQRMVDERIRVVSDQQYNY